jgi:hypothetical protein
VSQNTCPKTSTLSQKLQTVPKLLPCPRFSTCPKPSVPNSNRATTQPHIGRRYFDTLKLSSKAISWKGTHMRFWTVPLSIFLLATTAHAQGRSARPGFRGQEVFRGVAPRFSPGIHTPFRTVPRQNVIVAPQVPFYPYYPYDPYHSGFYSSQPAYSVQDQSANIAQINSLNDQIQRLENEVQRLQDELAATRAQQVLPSPLQVTPGTPPPPVKPTVLVFRDGLRIEIQGYAIVGQTLVTSSEEGFKKIALSDLNLDATRNENLTRGINFLPR